MNAVIKREFKWFKNQKGLTLIELLAVIVVLGIIAAIAVPSITGVINKSKINADLGSYRIIKSAGLQYALANDIKANQKVTVQTLAVEGFLDEKPQKQSTKISDFHNVQINVSADGKYTIKVYEDDSQTKEITENTFGGTGGSSNEDEDESSGT